MKRAALTELQMLRELVGLYQEKLSLCDCHRHDCPDTHHSYEVGRLIREFEDLLEKDYYKTMAGDL